MSVASTRPPGPTRRAARIVCPPAPAATSSTRPPVPTRAASSIRSVASPSQSSRVGPQLSHAPAASSHCWRVVILYCFGSKVVMETSRCRRAIVQPGGARTEPRPPDPPLAHRQILALHNGAMPAKDQHGALFVGRERPRRRLLGVLDEALAGRVRLAMVSGEAGIGKTALVAVVTGEAPELAAVCWGTCWAGAPGYWPWTQALDALAAAVGRDVAAELAGEDRDLLATIVPALGPAADLGHQGAFPLLDATARWIASAVGQRPAMVVLDDLHWADQSSLALLGFLARARLEAPLLIVGAYRDDEL